MLFDFFRRIRRIRAPAPRAVWARAVDSKFDLHNLSLGLESAMLAFLVGGVFYNQVYRHWFYTLLLLALVLEAITRGPLVPAAREANDPDGSPTPSA